ncbi:MAG: LuxR C-terminal-related transcriptional regulator [Cognatishimia sp.]
MENTLSTPLLHLKQTKQALENALKTIEGQIKSIEGDEQRKIEVKSHMTRLKSIGREIAKAANYDISEIPTVLTSTNIAKDILPETAIFHAKHACKTNTAYQRAIRNRQILRLARAGKTNGDIALELDISTRTITRVISADFRGR